MTISPSSVRGLILDIAAVVLSFVALFEKDHISKLIIFLAAMVLLVGGCIVQAIREHGKKEK